MDKDELLKLNSGNLNSNNISYVEAIYEEYLTNPDSVSEYWQKEFSKLEPSSATNITHASIRTRLRETAQQQSSGSSRTYDDNNRKQVGVIRLISAYRYLGHRQADIDPLGVDARPDIPELSPEFHGLTHADMETVFETGSLGGVKKAPLREIINMLSVTYCGTIGSEFKHIVSSEQKEWIQHRLEKFYLSSGLSDKRKRTILEMLIAAKSLEVYLHKKYVGQKRFSLEGGLSLIVIIDEIIQRCGFHKVSEVIMGMAHRGRLNVLVNILGKSPEELFQEFEDTLDPVGGSGDVKYHKGYSSDLKTEYGPVHTVLAFNPSHLEAINPVVEGSVRARQERRKDNERVDVMPLLIHGDAAFAGQGVVMETLNLSKTRGYTTGGTIHVIVNNQIGFTTSDPLDSRSTLYCTDVAKMVQAPIFHVNGDDPEAVAYVSQLALDFRMKFKRDVVIDMICYRQHGHNEADEPSVTQPVMYHAIRNKEGVRKIYTNRLIRNKTITSELAESLETKYLDKLQKGEQVCGPIAANIDRNHIVDYRPYIGKHWREEANTRISAERIKELSEKFTALPNGFALHRTVKKIVDSRIKMGKGEMNADWGFGETLAYASLLEEGFGVRISGQDSVRGTFSHRHAAFHDQVNGEIYVPLRHIAKDQPLFLPINSLLSEEAVLGYEVGYSTAEPQTLVIWEAQFGDFANNAQMYVDQFLSSSEAKWQRYCGLVMLLPHGHDGQGPEHSSARLERYLQLCAEENMQVCMPSTPAQMFHMLRRQMLRPYRKPLIVMTPKNILRDPAASSELHEFTEGEFNCVLDEVDGLKPAEVKKIIFCSGKLYYEILHARREHKITNTAIVRIEQLYPFPLDEVQEIIKKYSGVRDIVWCQEEPRNQGAWFFIQAKRNLPACITEKHNLSYAGRRYSASPASGSLHIHRERQKDIIEDALSLHDQVSSPPLRVV
jgi:2-oxoglutarate dehydrogenase E1 component